MPAEDIRHPEKQSKKDRMVEINESERIKEKHQYSTLTQIYRI